MKILKTLSLAIALGAMINTASAISINGEVEFNGTGVLDDNILADATSLVSGSGSVLLASGDYAGTEGSAVTFSPFAWDPVSVPVASLWSFTSGGLTYSFDLLTMVVNSHTANFLDISGRGIAMIEGPGSQYEATSGTWTFQITDSNGEGIDSQFVFNSSNNVVPDAGTTSALLGLGLIGLVAVRRFKR